MEILRELQNIDKSTKSLSLDIKQISDLSPLMPFLCRLSLEQLSLYGNRIKQLPLDMSGLRHLKSLDISNNLLGNIDLIILSLKTIPNLSSLTINIRNKEDQIKLKNELSRLQVLNGKEIRKKKQKDFGVTLTQEDLQKIAELYDMIREMYRSVDINADKQLADQFDSTVKTIMQQLTHKLKLESRRNASKSIIMAKKQLIDLCISKYLKFTNIKIPQLASILSMSNQFQTAVFLNAFSMIDSQVQVGGPKETQSPSWLQKPTQKTLLKQKDKKVVTTVHTKDKEETIHVLRQRINQLEDQLKFIQAQNKRYLQTMIRHSKGDKLAYNSIQSESHGSYRKKVLDQEFTSGRILSKRQLKQVIIQIYQSKQKSDKRQMQEKAERQTMQQHMYTFLIQKYGLKNLVVQWASAIVSAVRKFSYEDAQINLFGKMLRNQCDEDFVMVQEQAKKTISQLLKIQIRGKYSLKSAQEISQMAQAKLKSNLQKDEVEDIIKYMYKQDDSQQLMDLMQKKYIRPHRLTSNELKKLTREEQLELYNENQQPKVSYQEFLNTLLQFQLKKHQQFLVKFINLFQQVDQDKNGILSESQFLQLASLLQLNSRSVQKYLSEIDPFNLQKITFSQCVQAFSLEGIEQDGISVLYRINGLRK